MGPFKSAIVSPGPFFHQHRIKQKQKNRLPVVVKYGNIVFVFIYGRVSYRHLINNDSHYLLVKNSVF
jgi:hypothetical protein